MSNARLEGLIADSIARRDAEEAEQQKTIAHEEAECQALLVRAGEARLKEMADDIPPALRSYCVVTDTPPGDTANQIKSLRDGWRPNYFNIDAPGLATIFFTVRRDWSKDGKELGLPYIGALATSGQYNDDHKGWYLAIAEAARLHAEREKWEAKEAEREQRVIERTAGATPRALTTAERLESLIREIAREEINHIQTEDF